MIFIADQVYVFLYAILGGAVAAFLYDILRIKRRAFKTGVIIVNLEDILYWIVAAVFLFITVYYSNSGEMRGYIFIGNIIGVTLYEALLSGIIIASSVMIINTVKKILLFLWKIISYPLRLIYKIIILPLLFILRQIQKLVRLLFNKSKIIGGKAFVITGKGIRKIPNLRKKTRKVQKNT